MSLFEIIALIGLFMATFGMALPWIVSNDFLPLPIDILLFLFIAWVYGRIAQFYYKKYLPSIKKLIKGMIK